MSSYIRSIYVVFRRQIIISFSMPAWIVVSMVGPLLYLFLFSPLLESFMHNLSTGNVYNFFIPGLVVQLAIFTTMFVGFGMINEYRMGVIDSQRATPVPRSALLLGRVARDVAQLFLQICLVLVIGYCLGMRPNFWGVIYLIIMASFITVACASFSYATALLLKQEDVLGPVMNMLVMPVFLLSGILLPMNIGPRWLQRLSDFIPFKHIIISIREAFVGKFFTSTFWAAIVWMLLLILVSVFFGTRVFNKSDV